MMACLPIIRWVSMEVCWLKLASLTPTTLGNLAEPFEALGAHDDAELGGVVEHDGQVGVVGEQVLT